VFIVVVVVVEVVVVVGKEKRKFSFDRMIPENNHDYFDFPFDSCDF